VLGDDPIAALMRNAEQRVLQVLLDALQALGTVLDLGRRQKPVTASLGTSATTRRLRTE
jgi:hypothetical protein